MWMDFIMIFQAKWAIKWVFRGLFCDKLTFIFYILLKFVVLFYISCGSIHLHIHPI